MSDCTCNQVGRAGRQCVPHGHIGLDGSQHWGHESECSICQWQALPVVEEAERIANAGGEQ